MNILFILLLMISYFLFINLTNFFFNKKMINKKQLYITIFFSIFNMLIFKYSTNNILFNIICTLIFHLLYCKIFFKIKYLYNFLFLACNIIIIFLFSNFILYTILAIPSIKIFFKEYIEYFYNFSKIFSIFTSEYIVYIFIKNNILNFIFNNISRKHIKLFILIACIIIFPQFININCEKFELNLPYILLNFIQLLFIYFFIFQFIHDNIKNQKLNEENILLHNELKKLTLINDETRIFKHDFNNIINLINGYILLKKYSELDAYIKGLLKQCENINSISSVNANIFNHPAIYGVLIGKVLTATNKKIKFNIQSSIDYSNINFEINNLSRIIGILIDNAFEASLKNYKNSYVSYEAYYSNSNNCTIIKISNTFDLNNEIDIDKIFEKGYSNKEIKSGLGLWEVKKLIDKSKNSYISTKIKNELFIQTISISNKKYKI